MHSLTSRFLRDESGATATEYAMLLVFVALAIAAAAQTFGANPRRPVHTGGCHPY